MAEYSRLYQQSMAANSTLLCIHRDPGQLSPLRGNGYELITATNGSDGLRVLMLNPVDAVVIEYYLGLLDGAVVADEIKRVKPQLPIVMVADYLELPVDSLKSVDALVSRSDGPCYLLETIQSILQIRRPPQPDASGHSRTRPGSRDTSPRRQSSQSDASSFSSELWEDIRNGIVRF
ncbi:MAG: response regulator [Terriglobales bacterium]